MLLMWVVLLLLSPEDQWASLLCALSIPVEERSAPSSGTDGQKLINDLSSREHNTGDQNETLNDYCSRIFLL
jgi:hypothetical protein